MIAEVIPRLRTPKRLEILDYIIPSSVQVQPGMTVEVPFRNKIILGVVIQLKTTSNTIHLRSIQGILTQEESLSPLQIQLVFHLSQLTGAPLSTCLLSVLQSGQLPTHRKRKTKQSSGVPVAKQVKTIASSRLPLLKKTAQRLAISTRPMVVRFSQATDVLALVSSLTIRPGPHLILVPHEEALRWWLTHLQHRHPEPFSSQISKTEQRSLIQKIKQGQLAVVIGTRGSILLPPDYWTSITIIDEENSAYHQDQNPRFSAIQVATWLSQQLKIPCVLFSQSPRIVSAYRFPLVDISQSLTQEKRIIDLQSWREQGGRGWLSDDFLNWIQQHSPAVLFFNRTGQFKWLLCENCRQFMPIVHQGPCSRCGALSLKLGGMGTQRLEQSLKQFFPSHEVYRWDGDSPETPPAKTDILLTTSFGLSRIDWKHFQGVGIVSVDHQLAIPDFRTNERVFAYLTSILNSRLPFCLQSSSPEHAVIQAAITQNYAALYDQELSTRKKLAYPPFGVVVEFIQTATRQKILKKFQTLEQLPKLPDGTVLDILE